MAINHVGYFDFTYAGLRRPARRPPGALHGQVRGVQPSRRRAADARHEAHLGGPLRGRRVVPAGDRGAALAARSSGCSPRPRSACPSSSRSSRTAPYGWRPTRACRSSHRHLGFAARVDQGPPEATWAGTTCRSCIAVGEPMNIAHRPGTATPSTRRAARADGRAARGAAADLSRSAGRHRRTGGGCRRAWGDGADPGAGQGAGEGDPGRAGGAVPAAAKAAKAAARLNVHAVTCGRSTTGAGPVPALGRDASHVTNARPASRPCRGNAPATFTAGTCARKRRCT